MKALITGAAGFIGTNLTKALTEGGHQVVAIDSLGRAGSERNLEYLRKVVKGLDFKQKEIEDIVPVIYESRPDVVYHTAAQVAVTSSVLNPSRDFKINGEGTFRVANTAGGLGIPVIYMSTNKVFGDNVNKVPVKETETRYDFDGELAGRGIPEGFSIDATHHTPYGVSKLVGDLYVREFGGVSNRCSCMYGPHQNGIVDQGWLSHIAKQILMGQEITIYGDGKQIRDVLHVDDVTKLLITQGESLASGDERLRGQVFNVGGGYRNTISLLELCDRWGVKREDLAFEEWRPADQKVFYCDISKAEKALDWKPEVGLDNGLKDLFEDTRKRLS